MCVHSQETSFPLLLIDWLNTIFFQSKEITYMSIFLLLFSSRTCCASKNKLLFYLTLTTRTPFFFLISAQHSEFSLLNCYYLFFFLCGSFSFSFPVFSVVFSGVLFLFYAICVCICSCGVRV